MLVIVTRKKAFENAKISETRETGENKKNVKNRDKNKDLETNFTQVPYIQYPITF